MANAIPPVEVGMMLCRMDDGRLTRGPVGVGNAVGVQFPDTCPSGSKVAGSVHTHPKEGGGSILPSTQDIREAKRIGMPTLCIVNNDETQCYSVRGVAAAQGKGPPSPTPRLTMAQALRGLLSR